MQNKKLNILLINRWLGYNEGGNETFMKDFIHWTVKRGHSVTVITTQGNALQGIRGIKTHFLKSPKGYYSYGFFGIFYAFLFLLKSFVKFVQIYIKGERFDVISIHFSLEALLARFIKLFFGIPYVICLAGDTPLELLEGKRADGVVHVTHFMNEQSKKYGYSARVISKGIDLERFNPHLEVDELAEKYKRNEDTKVLLTVCRLDPRKNLITLIEAMHILVNVRRIRNIKLLIVGDGVERKFLEDKAFMYKLKDYVRFIGEISNVNPILPKYYVLADLFVLPTLYEGFGWVYLEAMACGTPILTTNCGSNPEVVGETGVMLEPRDPELLAETIEKLLDDPVVLSELSNRGLEKARAMPWEKIIKKYEEYYTQTSVKKCEKFTCRLMVLGYLLIDSFPILSRLFGGVIFNPGTRKESVWEGTGQVGNE